MRVDAVLIEQGAVPVDDGERMRGHDIVWRVHQHVEVHVDRSSAAGHVDVKGVEVDRVATPIERRSVGRDAKCGQVVERAGRTVFARESIWIDDVKLPGAAGMCSRTSMIPSRGPRSIQHQRCRARAVAKEGFATNSAAAAAIGRSSTESRARPVATCSALRNPLHRPCRPSTAGPAAEDHQKPIALLTFLIEWRSLDHVKIVVTVKLVPNPNAEKRIDPQTKRLVRTGVETVLNPYDEYALEAALQLKERAGGDSTVTIFSMAPDSLKEGLRRALAMGADDAVVLSDAGLEGSDVWATAYAISAALRTLSFDLLVVGGLTDDSSTGAVPSALAEHLGSAVHYERAQSRNLRRQHRGRARNRFGLSNGSRTSAGTAHHGVDVRRAALRFAQRHHGRQEKEHRLDLVARALARSSRWYEPVRRPSCAVLHRRERAGKVRSSKRPTVQRARKPSSIFSRRRGWSSVKNVIVYAEHRQGKTRKVTFEMASEAGKIAAALGGQRVRRRVGAAVPQRWPSS